MISCVVVLFLLLLFTIMMRFLIGRKCERNCWDLLTLVFGGGLPVGVFALSAFLVPNCKKACEHAWFDCFHLGKLALLPLVLWATAALFGVEMRMVRRPVKNWVVLGLFMGMTIAGACFGYGLVFPGIFWGPVSLFLLVPLYIAIWHGARLIQLVPESKCHPMYFLAALLGSIPFWVAGIVWSRRYFQSLPDESCFVVTAASRGHRRLVGPLFGIERQGRARTANRQLVTFWQLEALWRRRAPRSHAAFRHIYNRLGPTVARRIHSPWRADAVFVALKPLEWMARLIILALP